MRKSLKKSLNSLGPLQREDFFNIFLLDLSSLGGDSLEETDKFFSLLPKLLSHRETVQFLEMLLAVPDISEYCESVLSEVERNAED